METIIICSVFGVLALVFFIIGFFWRKSNMNGCTLEVEGRIVEVKRVRRNNRQRFYQVILGYEVNGQTYQSKALTNLGRRTPGAVQQIFVNPQNPVKQYRKKDLIIPSFLMFWGVFVFVLLLGIVLSTIF